MADNGFKINKSANFNPQASTPANPIDGDFFYDATAQTFAHYHNGNWSNLNSVETVTAATWMTGAEFTPAKVRNSVIKVMDAVATTHLAGISSSFAGKEITVYNGGSDLIVVEPDDVTEPTANNRIMTPTGGSMNLIAGEVAVFTYDVVVNRWLLVSISSQSGAQTIATTSSPGLVTLHQASLLPLDGVVLSDGDLNTATGVVGLDANRAAAIAVPLSAVTALDITAHTTASALVLHGGTSGTVLRVSAGTTGDLTRWTNAAGSTTYLAIEDDGAFNAAGAAGGSNSFTFKDAGAQIATIGSSFTGAIDGLYLFPYAGGPSSTGFEIEVGASTARIVTTVLSNFDIKMSGSAQWRFASDGSLAGISGGASGNFIHTVKDPILAQDAATKNYVDTHVVHNLLHNGNMGIWQRGDAVLTSDTKNSTGWGARQGRADRWITRHEVTTAGSSGNNIYTVGLATTTILQYPYALQQIVTDARAGCQGFYWTYQEVERAMVYRTRGKRLTLDMKIGKGSAWGGNANIVVKVIASNGSRYTNLSNLTGTITLYTQTYTGGVGIADLPSYTDTQGVTSVNVPNDATTITVAIGRENIGSFTITGATAALNFTAAVLRIGDWSGSAIPTEYPFAGGCQDGELDLCQRYYENTSAIGNDYRPTNAVGTAGSLPVISMISEGGYITYPWRTRKLGSYQAGTATMKVWSGVDATADRVYDIVNTTNTVISYASSNANEHQLFLEGLADFPHAVSLQAEMDCDHI